MEVESKEIDIAEKTDDEGLSKEEVFSKIFDSCIYGNLGLFIGAGFSKAVISSEVQPALNWLELIKSVSEKLELTFPQDSELIGVSLPEVSSGLCKQIEHIKNVDYIEAKKNFKEKICAVSNWLPEEETIGDFKDIFEIVSPKWIATTNYDLVLESILTGRCKSLSPFSYLSAPRGIIPIYHIHGTRLEPDSIIITQDDYIPLFRPNEYRQNKLAMTIRESTTLVLGYNLGDMNVLSALDWSKNIYTQDNEYPYSIIQVYWTSSPKEAPYIDENNNTILEISDLKNFLDDLVDYLMDRKEEYDAKIDKLESIVGKLDINDNELVNKFINNSSFRLKLLEILSEFEYNMICPYIEFLTGCIDIVWARTDIDGAFDEYDKYLKIILDIIINYEYKRMPPRLFQILAKALNRVLAYVGFISGCSWDAARTWEKRKKDIPKEMIIQLLSYSKENNLRYIKDFLSELVEE